jgi:hypothetical protein
MVTSHRRLTGRIVSKFRAGIGSRMAINFIIVIILFVVIDLDDLGRGLSVAGQSPRQCCRVR